jgi:hypothetical protein
MDGTGRPIIPIAIKTIHHAVEALATGVVQILTRTYLLMTGQAVDGSLSMNAGEEMSVTNAAMTGTGSATVTEVALSMTIDRAIAEPEVEVGRRRDEIGIGTEIETVIGIGTESGTETCTADKGS